MSNLDLNVLIVDDEPAIRRFLRTSLDAQGYTITEAVSGEDALKIVATSHQDIVILDLGLPGMDGVEVTRKLREWTNIPIIILSVREHENDKIAALDAGADDYLTKPFGIGELMARMRVSIRKTVSDTSSEPTFEYNGLMIDFAHREVRIQNQPVILTPTEYDLLRTLVKHAGKVLTHRQLLRIVWGAAYENEVHILRVNISNLRRKIEPDPSQPQYLLTEPGVGYRLKA